MTASDALAAVPRRGQGSTLSDGSYGRFGCAELVACGVHWFACVLAAGPLPARQRSGKTLSDTSLGVHTRRSSARDGVSSRTRGADPVR